MTCDDPGPYPRASIGAIFQGHASTRADIGVTLLAAAPAWTLCAVSPCKRGKVVPRSPGRLSTTCVYWRDEPVMRADARCGSGMTGPEVPVLQLRIRISPFVNMKR